MQYEYVRVDIVIDPVLRQITQIKFKMSNVFMDKFFFLVELLG